MAHNRTMRCLEWCNFRRLSNAIGKGISKFFRWEGGLVARNPFIIIVVCLALSGTLGYLGWKNFEEEQNVETLYAPRQVPSVGDQKYVREIHGYPSIQDRIFVVARDGDNENLLSKKTIEQNLREFMELWEAISNLKIHRHSIIGGFADVCSRPAPGAPCKVRSILEAWHYDDNELRNDDSMRKTINSGNLTDAFGYPLELPLVLGGMKENKKGNIVGAKVFQLELLIDQTLDDIEKKAVKAAVEGNLLTEQQLQLLESAKEAFDKSIDLRGMLWDAELVKLVNSWHKNSTHRLRPYHSSIENVERESEEAIADDLIWAIYGLGIVLAYSHFIVFQNSWAYCKSHLMTVSMLSVVMAVGSALGLALAIGFKFNDLIYTVPFLAAGLGIDDTFIILGAFKKTNLNKPPVERVMSAMGHAGSSIFVTSLTDLVAFALGIFSSRRAVQNFSIYASFAILFDFFYQVTFFVAFVVFEARRERYMLVDFPDQIVSPEEKDRDPSQAVERKMSTNSTRSAAESENGDEKYYSARSEQLAEGTRETAMQPPAPVHCEKQMHYDVHKVPPGHHSDPKQKGKSGEAHVRRKRIIGDGEYNPYVPSFNTRLIGQWLPSLTLHPIGKACVLIIEILALGVSIYGGLQVKMDYRFKEWFTPKGSPMKTAFEIEDQYFFGQQNSFSVFTKAPPAGTTYFDLQDDLVALSAAVTENKYVAPYPRARNWYDDFSNWLSASYHQADLVNGRAPNATAFHEWLAEFLLTTPQGTFYRSYVKFNANRKEIISTRFLDANSRDLPDGIHAARMVESLRKDVQAAAPALDPVAYDFLFPTFEGQKIVIQETIRNLALGGTAIFVISLLTLASVNAAMVVVLMVALTDVMLFGYFYYSGLSFNIVTSMNIVIGIGVTVDYSAHVAHTFLSTKGTRTERSQGALYYIGGEVFSGGLTTFLGVLAMAPANHYVLRVFFQMFSVIVGFGLWHGLVLLPVVLSFIGPQQTYEVPS